MVVRCQHGWNGFPPQPSTRRQHQSSSTSLIGSCFLFPTVSLLCAYAKAWQIETRLLLAASATLAQPHRSLLLPRDARHLLSQSPAGHTCWHRTLGLAVSRW